jgi:carboxymethylenebutenolidase
LTIAAQTGRSIIPAPPDRARSNGGAVKHNRETAMIKSETLTVNGHPMEIQVAVPEGKGPFPVLLLMYHRGGYDKFTLNRIETLAAEGFLTVAPDIFYTAPKDAEDRKDFISDAGTVAAIKAANAYGEKHPQAAKGKIAIIGHCMGGRVCLLGASNLPNVKAAAVFYGGGVFVPWGEGPAPAEGLGNIRCPVIGFFGNQDKNPSPADVDKIDAILTRHKVSHIFHRYAEVGHGFQQAAMRGDPAASAASEDAWSKMKTFVMAKMNAVEPVA